VAVEQGHWEEIYGQGLPEELSWFEAEPAASLAMIERLGLPPDAAIVDIGGGASRLAEELLRRGCSDITVVDIAAEALERAKESLAGADRIEWIAADVRDHDFGRRFALWHDRAVFHFMASGPDRRAYLDAVERSVAPGGHLILATFGPEGPRRCSGLPVVRYSADALAAAIGDRARLESWHLEDHLTPAGGRQQFLYAHFVASAEQA
jgi:SAM-dependent methyltransferase